MDSWLKQLSQYALLRGSHIQMLTTSRHTRAGRLTISKYHGQERVRHYSEMMGHNIILTTYGTVATEFRKSRRQVLYHMRFFRIVLDEGLL
jgi:hypothetical protein